MRVYVGDYYSCIHASLTLTHHHTSVHTYLHMIVFLKVPALRHRNNATRPWTPKVCLHTRRHLNKKAWNTYVYKVYVIGIAREFVNGLFPYVQFYKCMFMCMHAYTCMFYIHIRTYIYKRLSRRHHMHVTIYANWTVRFRQKSRGICPSGQNPVFLQLACMDVRLPCVSLL